MEYRDFQPLCERLLRLKYHDFQTVRAAGPRQDLNNDGYSPSERIFFHAHASRGESTKKIIKKIIGDFDGCLSNFKDVRKLVYLTNDEHIGDSHGLIDELRVKYQQEIDIIDPERLSLMISEFPIQKMIYIW